MLSHFASERVVCGIWGEGVIAKIEIRKIKAEIIVKTPLYYFGFVSLLIKYYILVSLILSTVIKFDKNKDKPTRSK